MKKFWTLCSWTLTICCKHLAALLWMKQCITVATISLPHQQLDYSLFLKIEKYIRRNFPFVLPPIVLSKEKKNQTFSRSLNINILTKKPISKEVTALVKVVIIQANSKFSPSYFCKYSTTDNDLHHSIFCQFW